MKVYRINENLWVAAESFIEAKQFAFDECDAEFDEEYGEQLSRAQMNTETLVTESDDGGRALLTFSEYLEELIEDENEFPMIFCETE